MLLALGIATPAFAFWAYKSRWHGNARPAPLVHWALEHWGFLVAASLIYLAVRLRKDSRVLIARNGRLYRYAYYGGCVLSQALLIGTMATGLILADPRWLLDDRYLMSASSPDGLERAHLYDASLLGCDYVIYRGAPWSLTVRQTQRAPIRCEDRKAMRLIWPHGATSALAVDRAGKPLERGSTLPPELAPLWCTCCRF